MNKTFLLLGSNIGDSLAQLNSAIHHIGQNTGKLLTRSGMYITAAWGNTQQPDFLNQVIVIETAFTAEQTLQSILAIEKMMGRVRTVKNAPRIIDIDILFFNDEIIQQNDLVIPHPEIQNRRFVLIPLNELAPELEHPVLGKTVHQLLAECPDPLVVKKF
ncbi:MAG: 2-amino-4-hydroxy-6-hydroxymethyldihydropteridine diphosphokinase [Ferruginibacter sp.]